MAEDLMRIAKTPTLTEIAGRNNDPRFYAAMTILPNPDPILRRAGKSDEVFDAIQSDSHVIGELRSIKADFLRFKHTLTAASDQPGDQRAFQLCQSVLDHQPAPYTRWQDVFWNIAQSTFRGLSVTEIVWEKQGDLFVPSQILDRPKRRFFFNGTGALRVRTREQLMLGLPVDRLYFLVDRHMPTYDNPYGVALLSSCYWPYVFKHAGFRWFVKFCERFGIPFPKGTYPVGASEQSKQALEAALEGLLEAGYAALEEGSDINLMEATATRSGKLPQGELIDVCNAEMSKALTSQTLATETRGNSGSRAASQTHMERASDVNEGDRDRLISTLNELWKLITLVNFGPDVTPPESRFEGDTEATLERAQVYGIFTELGGNPSRRAMANELGIELADPNDADDALKSPPTPAAQLPGVSFAAHQPVAPQVAIANKLAIESEPEVDVWMTRLTHMAAAARSLPELRSMVVAAYNDLPVEKLATVMDLAFQAAQAAARYDVALESHG